MFIRYIKLILSSYKINDLASGHMALMLQHIQQMLQKPPDNMLLACYCIMVSKIHIMEIYTHYFTAWL
ncbi:hypothetical protein D0T53_12805 [Dysgonomonas sp. 216]|nr:hypothetical protein [Dysgonomonas sp. 216]